MNLPYEGGGFQFCPKADPKDDRLDLILVEKMPKLKILCLLPTAFFGKHTRFHGVHIYTFKEATTYHRTSSFPTYGRRNPQENHGSDLGGCCRKSFP